MPSATRALSDGGARTLAPLLVAALFGLAAGASAAAPTGKTDPGVRCEPFAVIGEKPLGRAPLHRPYGLSIDHRHRLFIADAGNDRIVVLDAKRAFESEFGRFGGRDGQFLGPTDVAAREGFFYYVADSENERVQKFDRFRAFVEVVVERGDLDGGFGVPRGVEIDDEGRLYISDIEEDKVWVLDSFTGELVFEIGGFGAQKARFDDPSDIAIGPRRRIVVADTGNGRVQVFDRLGNFLFSFDGSGEGGRRLVAPSAVAFHPGGVYFVADPPARRVAITDASGRPLGEIVADDLRAPTGLVLDGLETLFISDRDSDVVHVYRVTLDAAEGD